MGIFGSINQISVSGNVGQETDFSFSESGTSYARFSVAVEGWDSSKKEKKTMWLKVICFGKTSEQVEKWVTKGTKVYVSGELDEYKYTDKEGIKRSSFSIVAREVTILDKANRGSTAIEKSGGADPFLPDD